LERHAVSRLNELDGLIEDAKSRKSRGEPPMQSYFYTQVHADSRPVLLPPESLVRAHTLPLKRAELMRLEQSLAEVLLHKDSLT
jgi:hypothetical protein